MADVSGALLLRHGVVSQAQIAEAHAVQQRDGGSFGECLVRIGAVDEQQLVEFYHTRLMIPRIADNKLFIVSPKVLGLVPKEMAAEFRCVPIEVDAEGTITLAMADPTNNHAVDEIAFFADRFVIRAVATESAVRKAIETHYGVHFSAPRASDQLRPGRPDEDDTLISITPPDMSAPPKPPANGRAPRPAPPPRPTLEQLDEQVVLLTRIKRSEETPLPQPFPPPPDAMPEISVEEPVEEPVAEPILLTRPKERERRDTLPGLTLPIPDPPLASLRQAMQRDEIAALLLDYVAQMTRRALFFVVKKALLWGFDGRGEVDLPTVRQLAINIEAPSIFRDVIASRLPYRGPLPETPANRAFAATIGGVGPEVLLMPVAIRDRIIAVLFADQGFMPLPDAALHAAVREAGLAYERLILDTKVR